MSHEVNLHKAQTLILRELLFHPHASYAQMQKPTGLSSDHFNFHIKRLVEIELVDKESRGRYKLSAKGKEYANRLDTDKNTVERQPKVAVILNVEKEVNGTIKYLFQQRLKNPYYGFWGLPSGKITWGEKVEESAARELMEEAGLEANWEVVGVYHEHATVTGSDELTEDKLFFVCKGTNPKGELVEDFEGGHNEWLSRRQIAGIEDKFPNSDLELDIVEADTWLHEHKMNYSPENF